MDGDIAVVAGSIRDFDAHPTSALLVVEVADSSLTLDTGEKARLYAAGRIADYWVIDVNNRQLIVHRDPVVDPDDSTRSSYRSVETLGPAAVVQPLAGPGASILVADLLP